VAHLIEVAFRGNRKEFYLWNGEEPPRRQTPVVVEADRGEDLGHVHATGDLAALRARGCTHGTAGADPTMKALRVATTDELRKLGDVRAQDETARREAIGMVKSHALPMKLTDAEWRWDRRKLTIYFTADRRVDFRALVRDLAARFRTRIELKQIGVRDEARRLNGVGRCGRQYCSAAWLPDLRPISLGLAKDQKLSLNPTQISGACGRLMCCLRHEHDWYVETRRRFPKEGKVVTTARGEERVVMNDLFRERVTLRRVADGEARVIDLTQLNRELRGEIVETDAATEPVPMDAWSDELLAMTDTVERPIPTTARPQRLHDKPVQLSRGAKRPEEESAARDAKASDAGPVTVDGSETPTPEAATPEGGGQRRGRRRRRRRGGRGGQRGADDPQGGDPEPGGADNP
jgi:cell fate regulator YaaT (PSP1 superfamily)